MSAVGRLCIVGVGLIGGSLALAAKERGLVREVVGLGRTAANLETARARGLIDRIATTPAEAAAGADVIVLAAPVASCAPLAAALRPHAPAGAVLTDVGSVKGRLVAELETAWPAAQVVGAHPIAGSEASGAASARADLFVGRPCILTPTARTAPEALARVRALWAGVGARVVEMSAEVHDEILARVSHLPHLVAYALVAACADARVAGTDDVLGWAGSGFRDTTRIAGSPAELWRDIALANAPALRRALGEFRGALDRLEALVAAGDGPGLLAALDAARTARRGLAPAGVSS
jgi:prephenate dehydrogenase